MQAVIDRAVGAGETHGAHEQDRSAGERVAGRLVAEFPGLARAAVERCVSETWICTQHLGIPVTPPLVERIAREHLLGMVNSVPPSGRSPTA